MNHKREVVDPLHIDRELPGAIEKAVGEGAIETEAERARIFEETRDQMIEFFAAEAIAPSGELVKYQETPLGQKYSLWRERTRHSESATDVRRDIYNHLHAFFRRYYQDGDFVPKRRYSWEHPYVVPYNGEEVHFHWANRDQYYVKAAEHFTDYRYRTRSGVSVRFSVRSANIEQNDVKGKTRFYFPLMARRFGTQSAVRWKYPSTIASRPRPRRRISRKAGSRGPSWSARLCPCPKRSPRRPKPRRRCSIRGMATRATPMSPPSSPTTPSASPVSGHPTSSFIGISGRSSHGN